MTASLYEIALGPDKSQRAVVDAITCEAPILRDLPMEPSSHGLWNIYESMKDVTGGDLVDLDAPLPKVSAESELRQTDLSIIGGEMEVGEDTARKLGGPVSYFAKKATPVLRKTGMSAERSLLYDNFRAFAIRNGNVQSAGGAGTKTIRFSAFITSPVKSPASTIPQDSATAKPSISPRSPAANSTKMRKDASSTECV